MRLSVLVGALIIGGTGCDARLPTPADVQGVYRGDVPGQASAARALLLRLDPGNAAELTVTPQGGPASIESGTWSLNAQGEIRVVLARGGFGPVTTDIEFRWARGTITAIAFDTVRWGSRGFALARE